MPRRQPPVRGLVTEAIITRVIDGDTVEVQPLLPVMRIRLLDCWAKETRLGSHTDEEDKVAGLESKAHLQGILPEGQRVTIEIPGNQRLDKAMTMGRLLGYIWVGDEPQNVSEIQVESGHATETKQ